MSIDIIKNNSFFQSNTGDTEGIIWASKNIDPELNRGAINVAKHMGYRVNSDEEANMAIPASAFTFYESTVDRYYCTAGDRVYVTAGLNPTSSWNEVSGTPTDCDEDSSIITFNSKVYVATKADLYSYTISAGFSSVNGLTTGPRSMCVYANRLYITDHDDRIESMDTSETYSTSGSYTIDLNSTIGQNQLITKIAAVSNGIWIATVYTDKAGGEVIFWDGVTENTASIRYVIPRGALAMTIKDDRPYILDSFGRLRVFDGTTFVEISRLPIKDEELEQFNGNSNDRWVHPNGMIVVNDEIYVLVNNTRSNSEEDIIENLPSGVWAWNSRNGFYHKYSFASTEFQGNSTGTPTDYGANNLAQVGALYRSDATGGSVIDRDNQVEIMAGVKYYTDDTTTKVAIGIVDSDNSIEKAGYFVTAPILAEQVSEAWKAISSIYYQFENSTDKIIIKYRTEEKDPTYATATWAADDILTTTTDLSDYSNGDEVEILQGTGSGLCSKIKVLKAIDGGYRLTLKETMSSMTGNCKIRIQKWKEIGDITDQDSTSKILRLGNVSSGWIQFKVFMIGKGRSPQLLKLTSISGVKEGY